MKKLNTIFLINIARHYKSISKDAGYELFRITSIIFLITCIACVRSNIVNMQRNVVRSQGMVNKQDTSNDAKESQLKLDNLNIDNEDFKLNDQELNKKCLDSVSSYLNNIALDRKGVMDKYSDLINLKGMTESLHMEIQEQRAFAKKDADLYQSLVHNILKEKIEYEIDNDTDKDTLMNMVKDKGFSSTNLYMQKVLGAYLENFKQLDFMVDAKIALIKKEVEGKMKLMEALKAEKLKDVQMLVNAKDMLFNNKVRKMKILREQQYEYTNQIIEIEKEKIEILNSRILTETKQNEMKAKDIERLTFVEDKKAEILRKQKLDDAAAELKSEEMMRIEAEHDVQWEAKKAEILREQKLDDAAAELKIKTDIAETLRVEELQEKHDEMRIAKVQAEMETEKALKRIEAENEAAEMMRLRALKEADHDAQLKTQEAEREMRLERKEAEKDVYVAELHMKRKAIFREYQDNDIDSD